MIRPFGGRFFVSPAFYVVIGMTLSIAATMAGFGALAAFNGTAGMQSAAPSRWPEGSKIERSAAAATILVFAHPFCPCTTATLDQLDTILEGRLRNSPPPVVRILFSRLDPTWMPGDQWRRAKQIVGASAQWDDLAKEARRFRAQTSGLVLLYNPQGQLLFQGGITSSRGHTGENYGAARLAAALDTGRPSPVEPSQVFGCALFAASDMANRR